jgi:predicted TIM-barrel fold metal-dependent hydrolase
VNALIDAHVHLYDPLRDDVGDAFPIEEGSEKALRADMRTAGVGGAVLVQPSVQGHNHELLVSAMTTGRFAGIGLVDVKTTAIAAVEAEVDRLSDLGLSGVRIHLTGEALPAAKAVATSVARRGLVLDVHVQEAGWPDFWEVADAAKGASMVVDHYGRPDDPESLEASAFLCAVARRANIALKLSGFEVISKTGFPYRDMARLSLRALELLGPERLMWASNFPYCRGDLYRGLPEAVASLLQLEGPARAAVMGGTAARIFSVPEVSR